MYEIMCILIITLFIISNLLGILSNPYCNLYCESQYIKTENGFCPLFEQVLVSSNDTDDSGTWTMTDAVRYEILTFLNGVRNTFAKGDLPRIIDHKAVSNMHLLNYDMHLEYIAHVESHFAHLVAPPCLRTEFFFVNYIHACYRYASNHEMVSGSLNFSMMSILNHWAYIKNGSTTPFNLKEPESLIYWANVDYVGCAVHVSAYEPDPFYTALDTVCMFGSYDSRPRSPEEKPFIHGQPCKRCRHGIHCGSDRFKSLCGNEETLGDSRMKWNSKFWLNRGPPIPKKVYERDERSKGSKITNVSYVGLFIYFIYFIKCC